jgi:hypothetical protein
LKSRSNVSNIRLAKAACKPRRAVSICAKAKSMSCQQNPSKKSEKCHQFIPSAHPSRLCSLRCIKASAFIRRHCMVSLYGTSPMSTRRHMRNRVLSTALKWRAQPGEKLRQHVLLPSLGTWVLSHRMIEQSRWRQDVQPHQSLGTPEPRYTALASCSPVK